MFLYLTYSCPHDPISSFDPMSLYFRLSLPSLIVIPSTDIMSAQNLCNQKIALIYCHNIHKFTQLLLILFYNSFGSVNQITAL